MPTFEMALLRVGLGAVLFAPKRRFMLGGFFYKIEVERLVLFVELWVVERRKAGEL